MSPELRAAIERLIQATDYLRTTGLGAYTAHTAAREVERLMNPK